MSLRELWDRGDVTIGGWCGIGNGFAAEVMAHAGFDWLCVDTQHGIIGYEAMVSMLQGASAGGTPAFVRVQSNDPAAITHALDAGAEGVIVPMVNTVAEAEIAVAACRYPPDGIRSWGPTRAALGRPDFQPANGGRSVICAVMIETAAGVANVAEIARVPGLDAIFVGPSDLAITHGFAPSGTGWGAEHDSLIRSILAACIDAGVVAGISCPDVEWARRWGALGFRMLGVGSDISFLRDGAAATQGQMRDLDVPKDGSIY
jgi:4-hydroxy-2-oxoheptanedioate aldolase